MFQKRYYDNIYTFSFRAAIYMKHKLLSIVVLYLALTIQKFSYSQILNVDRENTQDTIKKPFKAFITGSISSDKQRNNLFELNNTTELYYGFKNDYFFVLLNQNDLVFNGTKSIENNGYTQLRYRDNDTRKISPDFFTQYQWNGIIGLESRFIIGSNARFKVYELKNSDLYLSTGVIYEKEKWNKKLEAYAYSTDSVPIIFREMFRLNIVAKWAIKLNEKVDFSCINYLQFPLNNKFNLPRWFFDANLYFNVTKKLNIVIHYDHNLDLYRALPIDNYYYSFNVGFQAKI